MKRISAVVIAAMMGACAEQPYTPNKVDPGILAEMNSASEASKPRQPEAVRDALLPPLRIEMPQVSGAPVEPRFDLVVNAAPAPQVFMSIVSGTRYSMIVNPSVSGAISVNLKDVTVREALEAIREAYGFEFRVDGTRIYVDAAGLQTRVYQVNYLTALRTGRSDVRVSSGAISGNVGPNGTALPPPATAVPGLALGAGQSPSQALGALGVGTIATTTFDASRISTLSQNDLWTEVNTALRTLIGTGEGRSVVISPQSGVIVVRAMPGELRSVEAYLKAMRLSIDRQVMIEAKIVDVTLSDSYQTGINWAAFPTNGQSIGQVSQGTILSNSSSLQTLATGASGITRNPGDIVPTISGAAVGADPGRNLINFTNPGASLFGLAFQTTNFAALLTFLQTQGSVQVLSSPRIATLNNQKAVLKVGTDQFFVTAVTSTPITGTSGAVTSVSVTPTVSPFFSGVSLDITPQIDQDGNIILHIHPLVSNVTGSDFPFNFGAGVGTQDLQLAKSAINESDTVVRIQDGNIVVLGGLMQTDVETNKSGLPGLQDIPGIGGAFRSTTRTTTKRELVVLLKPTLIKSEKEWEQDVRQTRDRLQNYGATPDSIRVPK